MSSKIRKITAEIIFAVISVRQLIIFIQGICIYLRSGYALVNYPGIPYGWSMLPASPFAVLIIYGLISCACPIALLISAMRSKRILILTVIALVFFGGSTLATIYLSIRCSFARAAMISMINPILIIAGYYIYGKTEKVSKPISVADRQKTVYTQQLEDGIITQEEYDRLMNKMS